MIRSKAYRHPLFLIEDTILGIYLLCCVWMWQNKEVEGYYSLSIEIGWFLSRGFIKNQRMGLSVILLQGDWRLPAPSKGKGREYIILLNMHS